MSNDYIECSGKHPSRSTSDLKHMFLFKGIDIDI